MDEPRTNILFKTFCCDTVTIIKVSQNFTKLHNSLLQPVKLMVHQLQLRLMLAHTAIIVLIHVIYKKDIAQLQSQLVTQTRFIHAES
jgi:hypothetical protein